MTKKQIEIKYNCNVFIDNGFGDSKTYWIALGNKDAMFYHAYGLNLSKLICNIKQQINKNKMII